MQSPVFISHFKHAPLAASSVIGRITELQKIADALATGDDLLLLNGLGGVGKTTLAGFYMERYAERYGHIAWISCSGDFRSDLVNQLNRQRIPGLPDTQNVPELFAAMLQSMEDMPGPNLLIADNLNTLAQIDDLAQHKARFPRNWKMLITARCNTGAFPDHAIGVLSEPEAKVLFQRHYPLRPGDTEAQRDELFQKLGRHTLAIEFVAKTLAQLPSWNLERMLRHLNEKGLADLGTAATVTTAHSKDMRVLMEDYLRAIFEVNLGALGERSGALLAQLAMFPAQPHPFPLLCQVLGCVEEAETDLLAASLNHLKNNGLLEDLSADGWYLHPLLQEVARQKWLPDYEAAKPILDRLENALDNWPLPESLPLLPYAAAMVERLQFEDARLAGICCTISDRYFDIGNYPNSEHFVKAANQLYASIDNKRNTGITIERLIRLAHFQGDFVKAVTFCEQRIQIAEKQHKSNPESEDFKHLLSTSYIQLGEIYKSQGRHDEAFKCIEKGHRILEEIFETSSQPRKWTEPFATSLLKMGEIYQLLGKMDEALNFFDFSNTLVGSLQYSVILSENMKSLLADSFFRLGEVYMSKGEMEEALACLKNYNELSKELYYANQHSAALGIRLGVSYVKLASWHEIKKEYNKAIDFGKEGLKIFEHWYGITHRPDVEVWIQKCMQAKNSLENKRSPLKKFLSYFKNT